MEYMSWFRRFSIIKVSVLSELSEDSVTSQPKSQQSWLVGETDKQILRCSWESKGPSIAKPLLKNKVGGLSLIDTKYSYKTVAMKTMQGCHRTDRGQNRAQIRIHTSVDRAGSAGWEETEVLFNSGAGTVGQPHGKNETRLICHLHTKIISVCER